MTSVPKIKRLQAGKISKRLHDNIVIYKSEKGLLLFVAEKTFLQKGILNGEYQATIDKFGNYID